jgi:hypothetical protein
MHTSRWLVALSVVLAGVIAASCGDSGSSAQFTDGDSGLDATGSGADTGGFGGGDSGFNGCTPKSCADRGFDCGPQGDGCGAIMQCGDCPAGLFCGGGGSSKCGNGQTDGGVSLCTPKSCADIGAHCGKQGDGCGNVIDCGGCTAPAYCGGGGSNVCGQGGPDGGSNCTPKSCTDLNAHCGVQGDGCGNTINCGACTAPAFCGGGGTNVCGQGGADGGSPCTSKTCGQLNAACGQQGDGCGNTISCGTCNAPAFCGGGGVNQCGQGGSDGGSTCAPKNCAQLGAGCGIQGDGCGNTVNCGTCTAPAFCGGNGTNQCGQGGADGGSPCVSKTCAQLGATCGTQGDGCGNPLDCGTCAAPAFCGGGGTNHCGLGGVDGGSPCVPKTCAQLGATCGTQGDGCGNPMNCGACTAPAFCGGGGANTCGQGGVDGGAVCTPKTCAQLGANCGQVGDGCGGLTPNCGACTPPQICGGTVPDQCGTGQINTDAGVFVTCDGGGVTSISGTVVAGTNGTFGTPDPIFNAFVYVPSGPIQPITTGATCDKCATQQPSVVSVQTGIDGKFKLLNPPVGAAVPVVIQLGKWRRVLSVPVTACQDNALLTTQTHLPRNRGEGNIPRFAIDTGAVDTLECVLRKMGVDDAEFVNPALDAAGNPTAAGRIHVYEANPTNPGNPGPAGGARINAQTPREPALVGSATTLNSYDIVLFPCLGGRRDEAAANQTNVINYTNLGGRIFTTHFSYVWLYNDAPFNSTAVWNADLHSYNPTFTGFIDQTFPKGLALAQWLRNVTGGTLGQIPVNVVRNDFASVVAPSQQWMFAKNPPDALGNASGGGALTQIPLHYTFNTPVGTVPANQCGRVVYSDFHVEDASNTPSTDVTFPTECNGNTPMTPQEKLLEFMLFDLSSCISQDVPTCTPKTCAQLGATCGPQGDGCGGILQCGVCTPPDTCGGGGSPNACGHITCTGKTCVQEGVNCGPAGDGCGGLLQCGVCTGTTTCGGGGTGGQCGQVACTKITCAQQNITCGPAGDGCGGVQQCGVCTGTSTCGGGGIPGQCGSAGCTPKTCPQIGVNCGPAGDGCGGLLQCGVCSGTNTCGGGGSPGVCGSGACTPLTCNQLGIQCGPAGDGCGNLLQCGPCTPPQTCGGGGTGGVCGNPSCAPLTCAQQNISCGPAGDGCGGQLDCGPCTAPDTCGGGGSPGVCGHVACAPKTCQQQNIQCGPAGDGCGNLLQCGNCVAPDTCGGGGTSGLCGHPTCVPLTCAAQGISCGPAGDGCGGQLDCGTCVAPQTCGGGGTAGVCGGTGVVK